MGYAGIEELRRRIGAGGHSCVRMAIYRWIFPRAYDINLTSSLALTCLFERNKGPAGEVAEANTTHMFRVRREEKAMTFVGWRFDT